MLFAFTSLFILLQTCTDLNKSLKCFKKRETLLFYDDVSKLFQCFKRGASQCSADTCHVTGKCRHSWSVVNVRCQLSSLLNVRCCLYLSAVNVTVISRRYLSVYYVKNLKSKISKLNFNNAEVKFRNLWF